MSSSQTYILRLAMQDDLYRDSQKTPCRFSWDQFYLYRKDRLWRERWDPMYCASGWTNREIPVGLQPTSLRIEVLPGVQLRHGVCVMRCQNLYYRKQRTSTLLMMYPKNLRSLRFVNIKQHKQQEESTDCYSDLDEDYCFNIGLLFTRTRTNQ